MIAPPLLCLGISHNSAPLARREGLDEEARNALLDRLMVAAPAAEFAVLATCHRFELYATGEQVDLPLLREALAHVAGSSPDRLAPFLYHYEGEAAAGHLFRVAAGLESLILGEPQILGQVAGALHHARKMDSAGHLMTLLFHSALRAGRRARAESGISRDATSVGSAAAGIVEQALGGLQERAVLVVGCGEMGQLVLKSLAGRGVGTLHVANRNTARAARAASRWEAAVAPLAELVPLLARVDAVVTATASPTVLVSRQMVQEALVHRAGRPLVLVDIALPRNIEAGLDGLDGVSHFDVDMLLSGVDEGRARRAAEIPHVERLLAGESGQFGERWREAAARPLIGDLRRRAERIRQRQLARTLRHLPEADEETRRHIEHLTRALVNQLLHEPTRRLRDDHRRGETAHAAAARYLFGLDERDEP